MRKILIIVFFAISMIAMSQPMKYGDKNIGFNLGVSAATTYSYSSKSPAFTFVYDQGITEKMGVGYFSIGGVLSFSSSKWRSGYDYTAKDKYTIFGARTKYHLDMVELTGEREWNKVDLYGGLMVGFKYNSFDHWNVDKGNSYSDSDLSLCGDLFIGGAYNFYNNLSGVIELGFGVSYISIGISYRF